MNEKPVATFHISSNTINAKLELYRINCRLYANAPLPRSPVKGIGGWQLTTHKEKTRVQRSARYIDLELTTTPAKEPAEFPAVHFVPVFSLLLKVATMARWTTNQALLITKPDGSLLDALTWLAEVNKTDPIALVTKTAATLIAVEEIKPKNENGN